MNKKIIIFGLLICSIGLQVLSGEKAALNFLEIDSAIYNALGHALPAVKKRFSGDGCDITQEIKFNGEPVTVQKLRMAFQAKVESSRGDEWLVVDRYVRASTILDAVFNAEPYLEDSSSYKIEKAYFKDLHSCTAEGQVYLSQMEGPFSGLWQLQVALGKEFQRIIPDEKKQKCLMQVVSALQLLSNTSKGDPCRQEAFKILSAGSKLFGIQGVE